MTQRFLSRLLREENKAFEKFLDANTEVWDAYDKQQQLKRFPGMQGMVGAAVKPSITPEDLGGRQAVERLRRASSPDAELAKMVAQAERERDYPRAARIDGFRREFNMQRGEIEAGLRRDYQSSVSVPFSSEVQKYKDRSQYLEPLQSAQARAGQSQATGSAQVGGDAVSGGAGVATASAEESGNAGNREAEYAKDRLATARSNGDAATVREIETIRNNYETAKANASNLSGDEKRKVLDDAIKTRNAAFYAQRMKGDAQPDTGAQDMPAPGSIRDRVRQRMRQQDSDPWGGGDDTATARQAVDDYQKQQDDLRSARAQERKDDAENERQRKEYEAGTTDSSQKDDVKQEPKKPTKASVEKELEKSGTLKQGETLSDFLSTDGEEKTKSTKQVRQSSSRTSGGKRSVRVGGGSKGTGFKKERIDGRKGQSPFGKRNIKDPTLQTALQNAEAQVTAIRKKIKALIDQFKGEKNPIVKQRLASQIKSLERQLGTAYITMERIKKLSGLTQETSKADFDFMKRLFSDTEKISLEVEKATGQESIVRNLAKGIPNNGFTDFFGKESDFKMSQDAKSKQLLGKLKGLDKEDEEYTDSLIDNFTNETSGESYTSVDVFGKGVQSEPSGEPRNQTTGDYRTPTVFDNGVFRDETPEEKEQRMRDKDIVNSWDIEGLSDKRKRTRERKRRELQAQIDKYTEEFSPLITAFGTINTSGMGIVRRQNYEKMKDVLMGTYLGVTLPLAEEIDNKNLVNKRVKMIPYNQSEVDSLNADFEKLNTGNDARTVSQRFDDALRIVRKSEISESHKLMMKLMVIRNAKDADGKLTKYGKDFIQAMRDVESDVKYKQKEGRKLLNDLIYSSRETMQSTQLVFSDKEKTGGFASLAVDPTAMQPNKLELKMTRGDKEIGDERFVMRHYFMDVSDKSKEEVEKMIQTQKRTGYSYQNQQDEDGNYTHVEIPLPTYDGDNIWSSSQMTQEIQKVNPDYYKEIISQARSFYDSLPDENKSGMNLGDFVYSDDNPSEYNFGFDIMRKMGLMPGFTIQQPKRQNVVKPKKGSSADVKQRLRKRALAMKVQPDVGVKEAMDWAEQSFWGKTLLESAGVAERLQKSSAYLYESNGLDENNLATGTFNRIQEEIDWMLTKEGFNRVVDFKRKVDNLPNDEKLAFRLIEKEYVETNPYYFQQEKWMQCWTAVMNGESGNIVSPLTMKLNEQSVDTDSFNFHLALIKECKEQLNTDNTTTSYQSPLEYVEERVATFENRIADGFLSDGINTHPHYEVYRQEHIYHFREYERDALKQKPVGIQYRQEVERILDEKVGCGIKKKSKTPKQVYQEMVNHAKLLIHKRGYMNESYGYTAVGPEIAEMTAEKLVEMKASKRYIDIVVSMMREWVEENTNKFSGKTLDLSAHKRR